MAMSRLEAIMEIFTRHGKSETPVAIIQDSTTEKEKMVTGIVKDIVFKADHARMTNPAVIVIGEVVRLRDMTGTVQELIKRNEERETRL
jgi:uroporphyrin-III C-methyltransferase